MFRMHFTSTSKALALADLIRYRALSTIRPKPESTLHERRMKILTSEAFSSCNLSHKVQYRSPSTEVLPLPHAVEREHISETVSQIEHSLPLL